MAITATSTCQQRFAELRERITAERDWLQDQEDQYDSELIITRLSVPGVSSPSSRAG